MDAASRASEMSPGTSSSTPGTAGEPNAGPGTADLSASATVSPPHAESGAFGAPPPLHSDNAAQPHGEGNSEDAKRPRACEACRGLKVRCEMADEGPCRRCRKAGRRCVVTVRSRGGERQKKTDTRVAELEKKIDLLAATLQARASSDHGPASSAQGVAAQRTNASTTASPEAPRPSNTMMKSLITAWGVPEGSGTPSQPHTGQKRKLSEAQDSHGGASKTPNLRDSAMEDTYVDIVQRGLITAEYAEALLSKYNNLMMPHFPGVVFPPGETAEHLRSTKPLLFLALMAACTSDSAALQKTLVKELMRIIAEKVVCNGEKNLELVQALFVSVVWYWPPESFEELKFYQLAHMGVIMAIDLGLGRVVGGSRPRHQMPSWAFSSSPSRPGKVDAESLECRRIWLAQYILATNLSIGLRRANLMQWTNFMQGSIEVLQTSSEAAPTDKYLCQLVLANRLGEQATTEFSLDDPVMSVNLGDVRTQLTLKRLERELEKLKQDAPKELQQRLSPSSSPLSLLKITG